MAQNPKIILPFSDQKGFFPTVFVVLIRAKAAVEIFILKTVLFVTTIFQYCAALLSKNSTNVSKVETRTKQSRKIVIDIFKIPFLNI